jgi:hypothetical protein
MTKIPATFGAFVPGEHHIELATGSYLNLSAPDPQDITLEAIAHGLSQVCRFAGQTWRFYSVAEHACLVAAKLEADGAPPHVVCAGLHHDDSEAFIGDVTRPLKALLPGYADLEVAVSRAIEEALWLDPLTDVDECAQVKAADDWALSCEAYHLLPSRGSTWFCAGMYDPHVAYDLAFPYDQLGQSPERAEALWMRWHSRYPSQRSNDAPSTGANPALIRTQHMTDGEEIR